MNCYIKSVRVILITGLLLMTALTICLLSIRAANNAPFDATVISSGKTERIIIDSFKNPPYVPLGSIVQLYIIGDIPVTVGITDILSKSDGSPKYDSRLDKAVEYTASGSTVSFTVEENWATALSSNSEDYKKGSSYRCYRVLFGWKNGDTKDYAIFLKTDPVIIFEDAVTDPSEAREWLDFYRSEKLPWDKSLGLTLPEYPEIEFRWTSGAVTAVKDGKETVLIEGMPVWNVYLADLTGDGLPEFCATASFGSGIVDTHVVVYDYACGVSYELWDRAFFDYALSLEDGRLIVTQSEYCGKAIASGELAIVDGELTADGIDRTRQSPA